MSRVVPAILFLGTYVLLLFLVAELNASFLIHDAVVGPVVVGRTFALFLAPAAISAIFLPATLLRAGGRG
jgi:hypothetical protein